MTHEIEPESSPRPDAPAERGGWFPSATTVEQVISRRWPELAAYGVLLSIAAAMRLWDLGSRAMHHDESLHSYFSWELSSGNGFAHNPMMHGPFQFEANAAVFFLFGDSDYTARLLYALAGTALVALPYFLRGSLGRLGALITATLLAFSPAMFYFSRFARNDVLMAVWTLGLVVCMWRYLDEGKNRYLYVAAALLALAFTTKETAYIVTVILGAYLLLLVAVRNWSKIGERITIGEVTPPVALGRLLAGLWTVTQRGMALSDLSRPATFLVVLISLTLPQWSALASLLQDTPLLASSSLVLASSEGADIGSPSGGGVAIAALVVMAFLAASAYVGLRWNWSIWGRCALIFYVLWVLMYSTFFTHIDGVGSGMWRSLGYWIVQQDVARGAQPWYYYFMVASVYEFLPLLFSAVAIFYYRGRRDRFARFLVFWTIATFLLYILASEKMPWLLVNLTLPMIILSGKFLGDAVRGIGWRRIASARGLLVMGGVPLFVAVLWWLAFFRVNEDAWSSVPVVTVLLIVAIAFTFLGAYVVRRIGAGTFASLAAIPIAVALLALGIRAGWQASYENGDTPVEMMVYTQTSPDIAQLARHIEQSGQQVPITIDSTSGFQWPWGWYLRGYSQVGYPDLGGTSSREDPGSSILLIHSQNVSGADTILEDGYSAGVRLRHRWWFPEQAYRDLTLGKFFKGLVDRESWRSAMNYFLYREVRFSLGSEDAYVYFSDDFPSTFSLAP